MKRMHVKFSAIFVIVLIPVESGYGVELSRGDNNDSCTETVFECSNGRSNRSFQLRQCATKDSSVKITINGTYSGSCFHCSDVFLNALFPFRLVTRIQPKSSFAFYLLCFMIYSVVFHSNVNSLRLWYDNRKYFCPRFER